MLPRPLFAVLLVLAACGNPAAPTPTPEPIAAPEPTRTPSLAVQLAIPPTAPPATPSPTGPPAPVAFRVGNTGGDGVFIRRAPDVTPETRIRAWPDGTRLEGLGERVEAAGMTWHRVRDPDGNVGFVAAQFLLPDAATPAPATPAPAPSGSPSPSIRPTGQPARP